MSHLFCDSQNTSMSGDRCEISKFPIHTNQRKSFITVAKGRKPGDSPVDTGEGRMGFRIAALGFVDGLARQAYTVPSGRAGRSTQARALTLQGGCLEVPYVWVDSDVHLKRGSKGTKLVLR